MPIIIRRTADHYADSKQPKPDWGPNDYLVFSGGLIVGTIWQEGRRPATRQMVLGNKRRPCRAGSYGHQWPSALTSEEESLGVLKNFND
jgi:hypothetical protein